MECGLCGSHPPNELFMDLKKELETIGKILKAEEEETLLLENDEEELVATATERVPVRVAIDSGSVANVIGPDDLPEGVRPPGNPRTHFVGAGGGTIKKHGTCDTMMEGESGKCACRWQVADVTRPLHSVSEVTGPEDGPGVQDVLFSNKRCVVVPPGIVEQIMKHVKAVAEYKRQGGLYLADMVLSPLPSSFQRQGREE